MSALLILVVGIVLLALGYIFYGAWLAKQWGVDPNRETPAHTSYDGKDFVPANPAVLMGHHFSSIAGAGPINGPILASPFGWLPVFLWIVLGGIFFGAVHDFGALFSSVRHNGGSIGEVIKDSMGVKAQRLFTIFALLVLILVIASFTNVVASTFASTHTAALNDEGKAITEFKDGETYFTKDAKGNFVKVEEGTEFDAEAKYFVQIPSAITVGQKNVSGTASTATTSLLFILIAFIFGFFVYRKNAKIGPATILGIIGIVVIVFAGLNLGINMSYKFWVFFIAIYVTLASLLPVWMLLQPRDYLSSFLLYAMMILALFSIIGSSFSGKVSVELSTFTWSPSKGSYLFPTLFITVACGAVSGFHSLIGSGTTSKQLNSEKDAKVIGYGAMIVESALAIMSLLAIAVIAKKDGLPAAPAAKFAAGLATMFSIVTGKDGSLVTSGVVYNLLTLAVSVFALTSLDSGCRLARYMFGELFTPEGKTYKDLTGIRKFFATPIVGTLILVIIGCGLGLNPDLKAIWGVFGAANQLLAGLAMLAVAAWLGKIGKNNKMFIFPMIFMLCATLTSLLLTIYNNILLIAGKVVDAEGAVKVATWGDWYTVIWSLGLIVLAVILVITGVKTLAAEKNSKNAQKA